MHVIKAIVAPFAFVVLVWGMTSISTNPLFLAIVFSAFWAGWEWDTYKLGRFKTGLPKSGIVLWFCMLFFWIVAFPWFVYMRAKIARSEVPLRPELQKAAGAAK